MKTLLLATKMRMKQGEVLYTKTIVPYFFSWKKCLTGRKAYVIIKVSPENLCILWKMVVWVNWIFCYERYLFEHVFPVVRSVFCWFVWWCYSIVLKCFFIYIRSYSNVHMFTPFSSFLVDWIHECAALSWKWNANTVYWWSKLTTEECLESKMKKKKSGKKIWWRKSKPIRRKHTHKVKGFEKSLIMFYMFGIYSIVVHYTPGSVG